MYNSVYTVVSYRDSLAFVEEVEDVPGALMVNLENGPERLDLSLSFVRFVLRLFHLDRQFLKKAQINLG